MWIDTEGLEAKGSTETEIRDYAKSVSHFHCFKIDHEVMDAISPLTCVVTCTDLAELNMLRLPFPIIWIEIKSRLENGGFVYFTFLQRDLFYQTNDKSIYDGRNQWATHSSKYVYIKTSDGRSRRANILDCEIEDFLDDGQTKISKVSADQNKFLHMTCVQAVLFLVTSLASKNITRRYTANTRIGSKHMKSKFEGPQGTIYLSTTHVELPKHLERDPDNPAREGTSPRAHLRRGHIHTFATGPGRTERTKKWIEPVFVNADADFVAQARKYVVK